MAVCTVVEGATVTADELVQICADALGSYKRPKAVELTHEPLPKSVVSKVQRKVLREPYWEGHERRIAGN
jgi:acyl-CoA synthetase (AMP-forming)/AMP-acid ligase II